MVARLDYGQRGIFTNALPDRGLMLDGGNISGNNMLDLQISGSSKFKVDKTGNVLVPAAAYIGINDSVHGALSNRKLSIDDGVYVTAAGTGFASNGWGFVSSNGYDFRLSSTSKFIIYSASIIASTLYEQRDGVNAQTTRIYGTYTDVSNYERLNLSANSTASYIQTENAGTGTARPLYLGANNATAMVIAANGNIIANNTLYVANGISTTANTVDIYALPANSTLQSAALVYSNGDTQGSTLYLRPSSTAYNGNYGLYQVANAAGGFIYTGNYQQLTINGGRNQAQILSLQTTGANTNIGGIVNVGNSTVNTSISPTTISLINIALVGF